MGTRNIVVLIGNGFDLAHGFKTSFTDFANHLIENVIVPELKETVRNRRRSNPLFKEQLIKDLLHKSMSSNGDNYIDVIWWAINVGKDDEITKHLLSNPNDISEIISNTFLAKLFSNSYNNWFDIENAYFYELVELKNEAIQKKGKFDRNKLQKLNDEFSWIRTELAKYLKTIKIQKLQEVQDFIDVQMKNVQNAYIINFNYTNTIENYLESFGANQLIKVNHIHGSLATDDIVFGYGNDKNADYEEIKNLEIDEFLTYFKTFEYQRNPSYIEVREQVIENLNSYEILVLGHSLGTTDKTLLAELFDSNKCRKVYFFKRRDLQNYPERVFQEFIKLNYAASRIFSNEEMLRKKVLNFKQSAFFP